MEKIFVNLNNPKNKVDKKIFGHFCEHAFKNIYGGFYDPENSNSDESGLRKDVIEKLKKVKPTILRYPGGNFVSNYHWEDGIGPKENRKKVFEYAWLTEESNQFGTADFIEVCRLLGAEPYLCVNMGTGTVEEAVNWVEYCNGTGDTYYANLRRSHGYEEPFGVKYWGLGNEMFGPWQMNHMSAEDYAKKAMECGKAMKWVDPTIKLIACGYEQKSDWNYTVTKKLWQFVDYISAHHYSVKDWGPFDDDYLQTMCVPEYMEKLNKLTVAAVLTGMNNDTKDIKVAWDEWNMFGWLFDGVDDDESYTLRNAIVTAGVLNMFINNSDTIGMANYSTFVNINGAVSVKADGIVERPQYHVFDLFGNNTGDTLYQATVTGETFSVKMPQSPRLGREVLNINLVNPESEDKGLSKINYLSAAVTGDDDGYLYVSIINRHPEKDLDAEIHFEKTDLSLKGEAAYTIYNDDVEASNTEKNPENVTIKATANPVVNGNVCSFNARKHSINLLKFKMN